MDYFALAKEFRDWKVEAEARIAALEAQLAELTKAAEPAKGAQAKSASS